MNKCPMCEFAMKKNETSTGLNFICTNDNLHFYMECFDKQNNLLIRKISYNLDTEITVNYELHTSIITHIKSNLPKIKFSFPYEIPIDFPDLSNIKSDINTLILFS